MGSEVPNWGTTLDPRIPSEVIGARERPKRKAQKPSSLSAKGLRRVAVQSMIEELFLQRSPA
jgi:hypothetical protein